MMHEDAPKMSVSQSLTGSTSHAKAEMGTDDPLEYDMGTAEAKPAETIDMDIKIAYEDPSSGKYIVNVLLRNVSTLAHYRNRNIQCSYDQNIRFSKKLCVFLSSTLQLSTIYLYYWNLSQ